MNRYIKKVISMVMIVVMIWGLGLEPNIVVVKAETYQGKCGPELYWDLDIDTGVLRITGTGSMYDYLHTNTPWSKYTNSITTLELSEGVTEISGSAFQSLKISKVDIPSTVEAIADFAFCDCYNLEKVEIPEGVKTIGYDAFGDCINVESVFISSTVSYIKNGAFNRCKKLSYITVAEENDITTAEIIAMQLWRVRQMHYCRGVVIQ